MVDQAAAGSSAGPATATAASAGAAPGSAAGQPSAANAPPTAAAVVNPAFEYEGGDMTENFNLRPLPNFVGAIPDDQRGISHDVYEARNVLKLLKDDKAITEDQFKEFMTRVTQAGFAGCVAKNVATTLARDALEQIRADIVRRVGTPLTYRYLATLAMWAVLGVAVGVPMIFVGALIQRDTHGYGLVLIGAMVGGWFSVARSRWQIAFDTIPGYLDRYYEPFVRLLFVGIVAEVFALFLRLGIIAIKIGNADLSTFVIGITVPLVVGFIAGISERMLSVELVDRVQKALKPSGT